MKRKSIFTSILVIALALTLVLGVVGCDNNKDPKVTNPSKTNAPDTPDTPDTPDSKEIHVYTRDSSSGTREGFEAVVGFKGQLTEKANEVASNGQMAQQVGQDVHGIGYVSLVTNFAENNLKPLKYEGVEPSADNVNNGSYTLKRPFCFTTRAADDYASDEQRQIVAAFIAYLMDSKEGREVVRAAGGIVDVEGGTPWDELKADHPIVDQDNSGLTIVTGGSTSVEKAVTAALESFQGIAGNVQFKMDQTGSGAGWERVLGPEKDGPNGSDIGFASRNFKDDKEPIGDAMRSGAFCQDAIVAVVHADNPIDNVTQDDLLKIFTGATTNWDVVGK
ncbi:MAG: substrate-binding domain-containing protein [Saccharofermentanales bacterium]